MTIDEIVENFEFLEDWEDRYKYLIELGNAMPEFPDALQNPANKVQGCVSQVWINFSVENNTDEPTININGFSDAHIVRGLIAITLVIFSGKPAREILQTDEQAVFDKLDLSEHITPQRSNGLRSMVARIKDVARSQQDNA